LMIGLLPSTLWLWRQRVGVPDKQPRTKKEKADAIKARKALVARLEAEGIDSGLAWNLAKQASYTKQEPDKFEKLYGVNIGTSLKAYESERIMDELKGLKADLSYKAGKIGGQFQDIQEKYKDLGFYERGRGLVQAPISMGMEPGVRSPDSLASSKLRSQFELLGAQSTAIGEYITRAEKDKEPSFTKVEQIVKRPDLYTLIPGGGRGVDMGKAIESGYTDKELIDFRISKGKILGQQERLTNL